MPRPNIRSNARAKAVRARAEKSESATPECDAVAPPPGAQRATATPIGTAPPAPLLVPAQTGVVTPAVPDPAPAPVPPRNPRGATEPQRFEPDEAVMAGLERIAADLTRRRGTAHDRAGAIRWLIAHYHYIPAADRAAPARPHRPVGAPAPVPRPVTTPPVGAARGEGLPPLTGTAAQRRWAVDLRYHRLVEYAADLRCAEDDPDVRALVPEDVRDLNGMLVLADRYGELGRASAAQSIRDVVDLVRRATSSGWWIDTRPTPFVATSLVALVARERERARQRLGRR